jgi:phosphate transport system substrate-binding protein
MIHRIMTRRAGVVGLILGLFLATGSAARDTALEGKLVSAGSDTLGALSSLWAELLRERHPDVLVQVRAIGSGAAPTALVQGSADLGPMSRPMSAAEHDLFFQRYGYAPTAVPVAYDEIAVFVHRDNPIEHLTRRELDAMFSATRRCGHSRSIREWNSLRADGAARRQPVSLYGRSAASGTYSVFRDKMLCGGDFAPELNRLVGSAAIVHAVATDPDGIGYASAGHLNVSVKRVAILDDAGGAERSLARGLYLYLNRPPGAQLEPLVAAYIDLALDDVGQREVARAGYKPLAPRERRLLRKRLGLGGD